LFAELGNYVTESISTTAKSEALSDQTGSSGPKDAKGLGAYYTDGRIARYLLRWAIVTGREIILDPSCGDGVFLLAASQTLQERGGDPSQQVFGVEINADAVTSVKQHFTETRSIAGILHADFFDVEPGRIPLVDAVVGNPPFIRYQRFRGQSRQRALERAAEVGVSLSQLTSSWAPFLIHACRFVKPGGKLAMVAPAELTHATYARPVLAFLQQSFRSTQILTFSKKLFPRLSEDTVLVLADGKGEPPQAVTLINAACLSEIAEHSDPGDPLPGSIVLDVGKLSAGRHRFVEYLLPEATRSLYQYLRAAPNVSAFGTIADVGIGYVSGDNDFFHLSQRTAAAYDLPRQYLRPTVRSSSELSGVRYTFTDWSALHQAGAANLLLYIPTDVQELPVSLQAYLNEGVRRGTPERYKCRVRKPWYRVPHVREVDGLLTYMSGSVPKLLANDAGVVTSNALHGFKMKPPGFDRPVGPLGLAALALTALTSLSFEIEGHSLGGGMLKLEPTEAERVLIPMPDVDSGELVSLAEELDHLSRGDREAEARALADQAILQERLGLSAREIAALNDGWNQLRSRRLGR
jgi:adenine-specific DNA methylase